MKYKTLFRLMLKAVGVLLFVLGLASALRFVLSLAVALLLDPTGGPLGWTAAM